MNRQVHDDFANAVAVVHHSRAWSIFENATRMWQLSVSHSQVVAAARRSGRAFEALPRRERLRSIAIVAAVAAACHALLLGLVPSPLRPAVPRAFWLVVSIAAAVAAVRISGGTDQASDA